MDDVTKTALDLVVKSLMAISNELKDISNEREVEHSNIRALDDNITVLSQIVKFVI